MITLGSVDLVLDLMGDVVPDVCLTLQLSKLLRGNLEQRTFQTDALQLELVLSRGQVFFATRRAWPIDSQPLRVRHVFDFTKFLGQHVLVSFAAPVAAPHQLTQPCVLRGLCEGTSQLEFAPFHYVHTTDSLTLRIHDPATLVLHFHQVGGELELDCSVCEPRQARDSVQEVRQLQLVAQFDRTQRLLEIFFIQTCEVAIRLASHGCIPDLSRGQQSLLAERLA